MSFHMTIDKQHGLCAISMVKKRKKMAIVEDESPKIYSTKAKIFWVAKVHDVQSKS